MENFTNVQQTPPPYPGTSPGQREPDQRIEIMQPRHAWTAVARGAVLRGLEGADIVLSRKSRRHYGVINVTRYNPSLHRSSDKFRDKLEGAWKVDNRISWFIKKEQTCSSGEPILLPFFSNYHSSTGCTQTCDLMVCDEDSAPGVYTEGSTYRNCRLVVNLENVPTRFWRAFTNPKGTSYKRLSYVLGMQIESGGLRFDFRVDNVVYGDVVVEFDSA